ncbi:MAG: hypothetical protein WBF58_22390 [Xanthobacteraceae bacterium]
MHIVARARRCAHQERRNDFRFDASRDEKYHTLRKCRQNAGFSIYRRVDFVASTSAAIAHSIARARAARCLRGEIHRAKDFSPHSPEKLRRRLLGAQKRANRPRLIRPDDSSARAASIACDDCEAQPLERIRHSLTHLAANS